VSYALYDSRGCRGDVFSISGRTELEEWAEKTDNKVILAFLEEGHAHPEDVVEAIGENPQGPPSVVETLRNLTKLAKESQDIVIISDGIMD